MPTPDFILELRKSIGHAPLSLSGVTAVVFKEDQVLLVRRSDNGNWAPVTGILEPGEQPAIGARREVLEETEVHAEVERLISVEALPPTTHVNGDQANYLNLTFRFRYLEGKAQVGDDESDEVGWFDLDALPEMRPSYLERILAAAKNEPEAHFVK